MRIITALTRGKDVARRKDIIGGALWETSEGEHIGGIEFSIPEIQALRGKTVTGVCALGALYLGLAEAKKGYEAAGTIAADSAKVLAIGIRLLKEGEVALREDYSRFLEYGPDDRKSFTFVEYMLSSVTPGMVAEFNDDGDYNPDTDEGGEGPVAKSDLLEAFDLAIEFARNNGL